MKLKTDSCIEAPEQPGELLLDHRLIDFGSNIRTDLDEQSPVMAEFVQSILSKGLLQPIGVCQRGDRYQLLFGFRRLFAWRLAGLGDIPVRVFPAPEDAVALQIMQFQENAHRVNLDPVQHAETLRDIKQASNWSNNELSQHVHLSPLDVCRSLDLAGQPAYIKEHVKRGEMPVSTALEFGKFPEPERQELLPQILSGELKRDQLIARRKAKQRDGAVAKPSSRITAVLETGHTVTVTGGGLNLESFIAVLEDLLARARRVRPQGVEVATFIAMLRDQARAK